MKLRTRLLAGVSLYQLLLIGVGLIGLLAAQSSLRNALTSEQTYYTNNQLFGDTTTTPTIGSIEPNLTWLTAAPSVLVACK